MVEDGVLVVGGGGHIGLPLSLFLTNQNMNVTILDTSRNVVDLIRQKIMPFYEPGCQELLTDAIEGQTLKVFESLNDSSQQKWSVAVIIIGTQLLPSGEPDREGVLNCIQDIHPHLCEGALLILRSTVYPGTTQLVRDFLEKIGRQDVKVIFAPERIAEGFALIELGTLPQIIGADSDVDFESARIFFEKVGNKVLRASSKEAEFIKLTTNAYRFAHFALGNAIYLAAQRENFNYSSLFGTMVDDYPRLSSLPKPGYVGGPCLIKDTVQLQSFFGGSNPMTDFALVVNRQLVEHTIKQVLEFASRVKGERIGVLGVAFKPESDDVRDSPILLVMHELQLRGYEIKYFDPHARVESFEFQEIDELLADSDIIVLGTPHSQFSSLQIDTPLVNVWN